MTIKKLAYATFVAAAAVALVIGSAVPSEAAKKKKAAAAAAPAPATQPTCLVTAPGPVCATKGNMQFTYFNSCYAANDQAKSVKPGACKATKTASAKKTSMKKKT
jgi:hypothetical protein